MLLFGHVGVTLGASILAAAAVRRVRRAGKQSDDGSDSPSSSLQVGVAIGHRRYRVRSWLAALGEAFDIRFILVGSLLPDIIDKPLGMVLLRETLSNGRIYSHTLLFLALIGASGLFVYRRSSRTWLLALMLGTGTHLVLDSMWRSPRTLFWPAYGFAFEKVEFDHWVQGLWHLLVTNPATYITEIVGLIVMAWFLWNLFREGKIWSFIRRGRI